METLAADRVRRASSVRHGLDAKQARIEPVVERLFALHATDPATLVVSAWNRSTDRPVRAAAGALADALERDRTLVRLLAMRRTLHVVPVAYAPTLLAVYRDRLLGPQRKTAEGMLATAGFATSLEDLAGRVLAALDGGEATTSELAERVPELAARIVFHEGKPYGGPTTIGTRVMDALGTLGVVVRARSRGGWKTSRCTWAPLSRWLPDLPAWPTPAEGRVDVVRAYLAAFGPATRDDVAWWTGLPKGAVSAALVALGEDVVEVRVAGLAGVRLVLADALGELRADRPPGGVALLPALDPTLMAWQDRSLVLDPAHRPALFDRSGNAGPVVWADGRVVGGWASRADGEIRFRLFDRPDLVPAVEAEAERLRAALDGERVAPRFPTPLAKELVA